MIGYRGLHPNIIHDDRIMSTHLHILIGLKLILIHTLHIKVMSFHLQIMIQPFTTLNENEFREGLQRDEMRILDANLT